MNHHIKIVLTIVLSLFLFTGCSISSPANTENIGNTGITEIVEVEEQTEVKSEPLSEETQTVVAPVLEEGEIIVYSLGEFQEVLDDQSVKIIRIDSEIELSDEISFEREDDLEIHIVETGILVISANFTPVGCSIKNDGQILVNNSFERGITTLINNGVLRIIGGAIVSSGMSNTENYGSFILETDAELFVDRGSIFNNFGELINEGLISVNNGGQLNDMGGTIANNGTIDLFSYFNGEISNIGGSGTINDFREE